MKVIPAKVGISIVLAALLAACTSAPRDFRYVVPDQPEGSSGFTPKPGWRFDRFAVAAANPLATDAGLQILRAGGSAVDAAIAVQMVLALAEPQSSGIGGGAFLLHWDGRAVEAFDGRETAPAAATPELFMGADGKPMPFRDAVVGGRSVGVPGTVRVLEMAHRQHGKLPWATLFQPAIRLAEGGFKVSLRLNTLATEDGAALKDDAQAAAYFFGADGKPRAVGSELRNPALAQVLRRIAADGSKALHEGEIAQAIVAKVNGHRTNPGRMTLADLAGYQPKRRDAICHDYRVTAPAPRPADYRLCGFPPPSSGALAVGQILGLLANTNAQTLPPAQGIGGVTGTTGPAPSADFVHLFSEAARLAYADRNQYVGDPDFVPAPGNGWASLLDPAYLSARAALIQQQAGGQSMKTAQPGMPPGARTSFAPMPTQPEYGTSHISIADGWGNAIAMTTTIEQNFGSRQMVTISGLPGGFLLNNELTDFSFTPADAQGRPIANRVQPGKRPRSSMAPTLVFDKASGALVMSAGSPGGAPIILYTAKTLYGVLNWGMTPQQAIDLPNFGSLNGPTLLEEKRFLPATVDALKARGAEVREQALTSGLQALHKTPAGILGGADPRREGVVQGE